MNALVDFVAEDDEVVVDTDSSDGQQFFFVEDFAKRVLPAGDNQEQRKQDYACEGWLYGLFKICTSENVSRIREGNMQTDKHLSFKRYCIFQFLHVDRPIITGNCA